jgi:FlaA1/EpsC-like NDP-sugar epimerase
MNLTPLLKFRVVAVILIHVVLVTVAWYAAWWLRIESALWNMDAAHGVDYLRSATTLVGFVLAARLVAFWYFDLFQGLWRYVSLTDLVNLAKATIAGSLIYVTAIVFLRGDFTDLPRSLVRSELRDVPRTALVIEPILCVLCVGGVRLAVRTWREVFAPASRGGRRVLIVGAGDAGEMLLREMKAHRHLNYAPVGFLDHDARKQGTRIHGVPVLGGLDRMKHSVQTTGAEEVIMAIPSARGDDYARILRECASTGVRLRRLPPKVADIVRLTELRDVAVEDLLDREPVTIDLDALRAAVSGKIVLVTGAGGSIGSEVVRQLAPLSPSLVIALDRSENALFFLERELAVHHPALVARIRVGDVLDRPAMRALFEEHKPHLIIHAAAYKHVPLMEAHAVEAVQNNVAATRFLAELAVEHGVARFLLISSDKAVRPTSVMGATKRAAELALQSMPQSTTQFIAVRFGNVLGSDGSVVPLFRKQIREGGPVTVTHPDVVRYFMTISEAVGLVLQAGVMGKGGQLFHLDMGRPVKVVELAEKLIQLSGFRPHEDIEVRFIGLRPGEKMHEELLADGEGVEPTEHPRIRVVRFGSFDPNATRARIEDLLAAGSVGRQALVRALKALVPEYEPQNEEYRRILAEDPLPPTRGPSSRRTA